MRTSVRPKFQNATRRSKVGAILRLTGLSCITLGLAWTACYVYFGRVELATVFILLSAVGVLALRRSRRSDSSSILIVAHGIFLAICAIAFIDAPIAWIPRSVHLYLIPLAAGAAFIFEPRERYGSLAFPLICLAVFIAFATGALDPLAPALSPPIEVRALGVVANTSMSMALLAALFGIHRADIGKQLRTERELGRAVSHNEIEVHYQPQLLGNGAVTGVEALVRWRHPSGRLLAPDAFIPLAEESRLIREIGLEVLRQACETLRQWSAEPRLRGLKIAVNISPVQLEEDDFVASVNATIRASGVTPSLLEFELTESALAADPGTVIARMKALEAVGVTWAMDDFGTGYSSLATLRRLPVRKIKIDRQFVQEAVQQESAQRLLGKIVEIPQVLGMIALAEGVETPAQLQLLIDMGCNHFQGFLFAGPMPLAVLEAWLAENRMHATLSPATPGD